MQKAVISYKDEQFFFVSVDGETWLETRTPDTWTDETLSKKIKGENGTFPLTAHRSYLERYEAAFFLGHPPQRRQAE